MLCKSCKGKSKVVDTREVSGGVRRRRKCLQCGRRWSSWEVEVEEAARGSKMSKKVMDQYLRQKLEEILK